MMAVSDHQTADVVTFNYEWSHKKRLSRHEGAPPPSPEDTTNWNPDSARPVGGNTLVVDNTNFSVRGSTHNFSSAALRDRALFAAWSRRAADEATIEDPKVFTRPWTIRMQIQRQKDVGILDYECTAMLDELGIHHTWPREFEPPEL
jgi:hypothetical protein